VGVVVAADGLVRGVELITSILSGAHGARAVAVAATGVGAGTGVDFSRGGQDRGEQQSCDGDELVSLLGWWNAYLSRGVGVYRRPTLLYNILIDREVWRIFRGSDLSYVPWYETLRSSGNIRLKYSRFLVVQTSLVARIPRRCRLYSIKPAAYRDSRYD
jgi:hypothetical protein